MLLKALAESVAIFSMLIVLTHIFIINYANTESYDSMKRRLIAGASLGAVACVGIVMNALLFNGLADGKIFIIAAAGVFYGWIPATVAAIISFLFLLICDPDYTDLLIYALKLIIIVPFSCIFSRFFVRLSKKAALLALLPFSISVSITSVIISMLHDGRNKALEDLGHGVPLLALLLAIFMYGIGWLFLFEKGNREKEAQLRRNNDELACLNEQLCAAEEQLRAQFEDLLTSRDIIERSELKYKMLFETGNEGLWTFDPASKEAYYSDRMCEICGFDKSQKQRFLLDPSEYVHEDHKERIRKAFNLIQTGTIDKLSVDYPSRFSDGTYRWLRLKAASAKNAAGKVFWFVGSVADIHKKHMHDEDLYRDAYYDTLTGLPNRKYLFEDLEELILKCGAESKIAVIQIDLDNFKLINDTFGHGFGDRILGIVGKRLEALGSDKVLVARSSGDEFIARLKDISMDDLEHIEKTLRGFLDQSISLDDNQLHMTSSAGIAIYPDDGKTAEILLKNVDAAMYHAKRSGKNQCAYYNYEITQQNQERMNIEQGLRTALRSNEFILYYQPQFRAADLHIFGYEALIRWKSENFGIVSPDRFIPVAEETGMIIAIGDWTFREACLFSMKINTAPERPLVVSVNISIVQLLQDDFVKKIRKTIEETHANVGHLAIEITESQVMESLESNLGKIEEIRAMGLQVFLDDFGTGYSSLSYLLEIPASKLKIDKSFIADIETKGARRSITRSIIQMADDLGMASIAEGVETEGQLKLLQEMNCAYIQGYLLGRPVPEEEAMRFLS